MAAVMYPSDQSDISEKLIMQGIQSEKVASTFNESKSCNANPEFYQKLVDGKLLDSGVWVSFPKCEGIEVPWFDGTAYIIDGEAFIINVAKTHYCHIKMDVKFASAHHLQGIMFGVVSALHVGYNLGFVTGCDSKAKEIRTALGLQG
ncbi:TPA: hypothetical protein ACF33U_004207 [Vibrio parahaemolyticus]